MEKLANISAFESLQSNSSAVIYNGKIKDKVFDFLTPQNKEVSPLTEEIEQIDQRMHALSDEHDKLKAVQEEYITKRNEARRTAETSHYKPNIEDARAEAEELEGLISDTNVKMMDVAMEWQKLEQLADRLRRKKHHLLADIRSQRIDYDKSPVGYTAGTLAGLLRKTISPKIEAFKRGFSK